MEAERIQHIKDVLFTNQTVGSKSNITITQEEAKELIEFAALQDHADCKNCNGTGIVKDEMAGEGCVTDCYCNPCATPPNSEEEEQPLKEEIPTEYIICSAIHFNDGKEHPHQPKNITSGFVISGRRHHNCYTTFQAIGKALGYEATLIVKKGVVLEERECQGFITNTDRFVDRKEGWNIAKASNQIKFGLKASENGNDSILISENLY